MARFAAGLLSLIAFHALCFTARAEPFETSGVRQLHLSAPALDVAVSPDGRFTFVLEAGGVIEIFDPGHKAVQTIKLDGDFDHIAIGPTGTDLILTGRTLGKATILSLEPVVQIDTRGSPVKGYEKAPVTIAVYSDFQ